MLSPDWEISTSTSPSLSSPGISSSSPASSAEALTCWLRRPSIQEATFREVPIPAKYTWFPCVIIAAASLTVS